MKYLFSVFLTRNPLSLDDMEELYTYMMRRLRERKEISSTFASDARTPFVVIINTTDDKQEVYAPISESFAVSTDATICIGAGALIKHLHAQHASFISSESSK